MANGETLNLDNLNSRLSKHYGAKKEICKRTGFNREYIRLVLTGSRYSQKVIEAAYEVLVEREEQAAEHRSRVRHMETRVLELQSS